MPEPIWHTGWLADLPDPGQRPLVWLARLDDPRAEALARQAPLRPQDLLDLAQRPQAAMRGLRRQLARVLLARLAGVHPDTVVLGRTAAGAPLVAAPAGWHVSVAGRWPHALIGVARGALGVDIEPAGAPPPPDDALTPGERLALIDDAGRLRCWTAKEAHAKALGVAAQIDPAAIHTQALDHRLLVASAEGETLCYTARIDTALCAAAQPRLSAEAAAALP
jgi:phosphopantetheinyl transferase